MAYGVFRVENITRKSSNVVERVTNSPDAGAMDNSILKAKRIMRRLPHFFADLLCPPSSGLERSEMADLAFSSSEEVAF